MIKKLFPIGVAFFVLIKASEIKSHTDSNQHQNLIQLDITMDPFVYEVFVDETGESFSYANVISIASDRLKLKYDIIIVNGVLLKVEGLVRCTIYRF